MILMHGGMFFILFRCGFIFERAAYIEHCLFATVISHYMYAYGKNGIAERDARRG